MSNKFYMMVGAMGIYTALNKVNRIASVFGYDYHDLMDFCVEEIMKHAKAINAEAVPEESESYEEPMPKIQEWTDEICCNKEDLFCGER